jgi:hypothetical protein
VADRRKLQRLLRIPDAPDYYIENAAALNANFPGSWGVILTDDWPRQSRASR